MSDVYRVGLFMLSMLAGFGLLSILGFLVR